MSDETTMSDETNSGPTFPDVLLTDDHRCPCDGTARPVTVRMTNAEVEVVSQMLQDEVSKCRAEVEHWSRDRRWAYAGARRLYHEQRAALLAALLSKMNEEAVPS